MAANTKDIKRKYNTPGVIDGDLAHQLDRYDLERRLERSGQLDFDQQYRQRKVSEAEQLHRRRVQTKAAVRPAQSVAPVMVAGFAPRVNRGEVHLYRLKLVEL